MSDLFSISESVWAMASTLGAVISGAAANEALADYRNSTARTRMVAYKNAVGQSGLFVAQALQMGMGWLAVFQPPTPAQLSPVLQTWIFYAATPTVALILLITSLWVRVLYWRLIGTAGGKV